MPSGLTFAIIDADYCALAGFAIGGARDGGWVEGISNPHERIGQGTPLLWTFIDCNLKWARATQWVLENSYSFQVAYRLPQVRAGTIKAYALTAKNRLLAAPDIPTVDEAGLSGLYALSWQAVFVPKSTPKDVVTRLNSAVVTALADPTVRRRLADIGQEIFPGEQQTPQALATYQKAEIEKWWPIVKEANIKAE